MPSRKTALALVLCFAFLMAPWPSAHAQDGDAVSISTRMMLTAVESLDGTGRVSYVFEGAPAYDLRLAVMTKYDLNRNMYIEASEAVMFLSDLGDELDGRQYWGVTIHNPTNYSAMTESDVTNKTSGLVNTVLSSPSVIEFGFDFDASGEGSNKLLRLSELAIQTLLRSVETVAGFTCDGTLHVSDRITVFGTPSYTSPDLVDGRISELRTPMGSVFWFSFSAEIADAGSSDGETITYETFNVLENQQIVFVLLLVGCMFVLRIPAKRYEKYRLEHPKKFRKSAKPLPTVRVFSWAIVALLAALYLFPFMFSFAGRNMLFNASYLYFVVPAAVIGTYLFTRAMYGRASVRIPEDVVIEVKQAYVGPESEPGDVRCQICMMPMESGHELYECTCGFTMHVECARRSQTCPLCGEVLFPEHTRSIECKACGETFLTSGEEDPYALQCTRCGAFQEELKGGTNYLVVDIDGKRAYNMIRSVGLSNRPAMVLTCEFPGKVREENGLGDDFEVKWLTEVTGDIDSVDIKDLEGDVMETVSTFLMTTRRSGLLVDGIESIISTNGFDGALAFIRQLNDLSKTHGSSVIVWMDRGKMPQEQSRAVSDEFDEIHDYL